MAISANAWMDDEVSVTQLCLCTLIARSGYRVTVLTVALGEAVCTQSVAIMKPYMPGWNSLNTMVLDLPWLVTMVCLVNSNHTLLASFTQSLAAS